MIKPWTIKNYSGIDNFHDSNHQVFQAGTGRDGPLPTYLTSASDIIIDDSNKIVPRKAFASYDLTLDGEEYAPTNSKALSEAPNIVLYQDDSSLYKINHANGALTLLHSLSSSDRLSFCEHAGQIFYTNGADKGRIVGGAKKNWGVALPPVPTLTGVAGALPAGRYLVSVAYIDSSGIEHAANKAAAITVDGTKNIQLSLSSIADDAVYVRIYMSQTDTRELFYHSDAAVGAFPVTLTSLPSDQGQCFTIGLVPPLDGNVIFSLKDYLIICEDQFVHPSFGKLVHLYNPSEITIARPENIIAGAGLDDGFWTVSSRSAYWSAGVGHPNSWRLSDEFVNAKFAAGSKVVNSRMLPFLGLQPQTIALFMSEYGLAVGTSGTMLFPFKSRYRADVDNKVAQFAIIESDVNQLIINMADQ